MSREIPLLMVTVNSEMNMFRHLNLLTELLNYKDMVTVL